jgi:hypothetical protein
MEKQAVGHERDIRPLLREKDQLDSMALDLAPHNDVRAKAERILRLSDGRCPATALGREWVELFRSWVDAGCAD